VGDDTRLPGGSDAVLADFAREAPFMQALARSLFERWLDVTGL
jgi:hypothetical protein